MRKEKGRGIRTSGKKCKKEREGGREMCDVRCVKLRPTTARAYIPASTAIKPPVPADCCAAKAATIRQGAQCGRSRNASLALLAVPSTGDRQVRGLCAGGVQDQQVVPGCAGEARNPGGCTGKLTPQTLLWPFSVDSIPSASDMDVEQLTVDSIPSASDMDIEQLNVDSIFSVSGMDIEGRGRERGTGGW